VSSGRTYNELTNRPQAAFRHHDRDPPTPQTEHHLTLTLD